MCWCVEQGAMTNVAGGMVHKEVPVLRGPGSLLEFWFCPAFLVAGGH